MRKLTSSPELSPHQAAGTKATKLELAGSYDQAFRTYVQAAQAYLFLIRHTQDGETKSKLRGISNKLVQRAEKIKEAKKSTLGPLMKDRLSLGELAGDSSAEMTLKTAFPSLLRGTRLSPREVLNSRWSQTSAMGHK